MPDAGSVQFFDALAEMARTSTVVIDRPRNKPHPKIPEAIYPVDYGHLEGTTSGDGEGIDVFVGSATGAGVVAVLLTADLVKRDTEIKLVLDCTPAEIEAVRSFLVDVLEIGAHLVTRTN
ncbi:inorganic pyrophosphatase [Streptoalloteichus tenebrarius]|uniref:Inorganic pyrophosphatase n=1 Tax=Streptoalloteichus tenebrarius (strain ATCC 17920 / DSM 40477 / JCM 4838 / CBS 697.72 / NBRC 16177 / NCIMB 11028 / NRRL B-12390 / A12253. 1 / ISP 5477) TaxID=1933 RepID=A0ABT1HRJ8_STRSD|nr:inorganic pyrophosphatase [Streptoalloteichus tenebrarius]MCP2258141.1 inorganic pyrophosphatase [Streptoalloteichus tenebrarius]BFF04632.1 hypothetical protein GCM10020241_63070 [Streptoalloteichus tenebrarius]